MGVICAACSRPRGEEGGGEQEDGQGIIWVVVHCWGSAWDKQRHRSEGDY